MSIIYQYISKIALIMIITCLAGCAKPTQSPSQNHKFEEANQMPMQSVALLLPLSGKLKQAGQTILDGFMTTYYNYAKWQSHQMNIIVLDTESGKNAVNAYHQALSHNVDFIIGPLAKTSIMHILDDDSGSIETLLLNYSPDQSRSNHLYEFGFSPEQEGISIASRMYNAGLRSVVIIGISSDWSNRIEHAFIESFTQLGGHVVSQAAFNDKNLEEQMKVALNIKQSEKRIGSLNWLMGQKVKTIRRRRQDIDSFFIIANGDQAQRIKPLLRFYFAGKLPVYASSIIYPLKTPDRNNDLKGIIFPDIPWIVSDSSTKTYALSHFPMVMKNYPDLFALGIDSYRIMLNLDQFKHISGYVLNGQTGEITLDDQNRFIRYPIWLQFQKDRIEQLPAISNEVFL